MEQGGAFTRNEDGSYHIDFEKAEQTVRDWAALILKTQATGDRAFAEKFRNENGQIMSALQKDLDNINAAGIPRDIRFNQGLKVLGASK